MFYSARLCDFDGKTVTAEIEDVYRAPSEPKLSITLYQGAPKAAKLELIVQKATEIGVVRIVPMNTARTVAKLEKASKLDRLRKIALKILKKTHVGFLLISSSHYTPCLFRNQLCICLFKNSSC